MHQLGRIKRIQNDIAELQSGIGFVSLQEAYETGAAIDVTIARGPVTIGSTLAEGVGPLSVTMDASTLLQVDAAGGIQIEALVNRDIEIGASGTGGVSLKTGGGARLTVAPAGNVGIGTQVPIAAALLELNSTTQALLLPRLTTAQRDAIASPVAGLVIFNTTTQQHEAFNGSSWVGTSVEPLQGAYDAGQTVAMVSTTGNVVWNATDAVGWSIQKGGSDVIAMDTAGEVNITPPSGQSFNVNTSGVSGVGIVGNAAVDIDSTTDDVTLGTAGVPRITVENAGDVKIGIGTLVSPLHFFYDSTTDNATTGFTIEQTNISGNVMLHLVDRFARYVIGTDNSDDNELRISPGPFINASVGMNMDRTTGNIGIGNSTASPAAVLTLGSQTKGFLPPRMTTAQMNGISGASAGMIVYDNTTNELNVRGTSAFAGVLVSGASAGGALSGTYPNPTLATAFLPLTGGTMSGDVIFPDDKDAIFGNATDLTIRHTGTDSQIVNNTGKLSLFSNGTGGFLLSSGGATDQIFKLGTVFNTSTFRIQSTAGADRFTVDGAGDVKVVSGSLTVSGSAVLTVGDAAGGDLSGTFPSPSVATVGGTAAATIGAHPALTNNPHSVTAAQTGALPTTGGNMSGNLSMISGTQIRFAGGSGNNYLLGNVGNSGRLGVFTSDVERLGIALAGAITMGSLKSGTLVSPPSSLVSGELWEDTTDSAAHPIVRIAA